jgi:hypothetical protein
MFSLREQTPAKTQVSRPEFRDSPGSTRVRTQSAPSLNDRRDGDRGGEVSRELVVAGVDAPPVLQPPDGAFDDVPLAVVALVKGMPSLPGGIVRDDRLGATLLQEGPQGIAVIGRVGQAESRRGQRAQQRLSRTGVPRLTGRQQECEDATRGIGDQMDLRAAPAARTPYGLEIRPPFPPAAERCALAVVLSIKCSPPGVTSTRAASICCQMFRPDQR